MHDHYIIIALTYLERLFPGVLSDMCPQNAGGCESFVAVHALVRTFSAVNLWKQKELVTRSEINDKVSRQTKSHHFNRPVFSHHASFQSISYQLVKDQNTLKSKRTFILIAQYKYVTVQDRHPPPTSNNKQT